MVFDRVDGDSGGSDWTRKTEEMDREEGDACIGRRWWKGEAERGKGT